MVGGYARDVGAVLLLLGTAGMLGVGTTSPMLDLINLFCGGVLIYAGRSRRLETSHVCSIVGGMGMLCLLGFVLGFAVPVALFGTLPDDSNGTFTMDLVYLAVSIPSMLVAKFSRCADDTGEDL